MPRRIIPRPVNTGKIYRAAVPPLLYEDKRLTPTLRNLLLYLLTLPDDTYIDPEEIALPLNRSGGGIKRNLGKLAGLGYYRKRVKSIGRNKWVWHTEVWETPIPPEAIPRAAPKRPAILSPNLPPRRPVPPIELPGKPRFVPIPYPTSTTEDDTEAFVWDGLLSEFDEHLEQGGK